MKKCDWIYFTAIFMLAWLLLDIGFGMDCYTKFPSWQWHLGFVLRNAGAILLLLLGNFVGMKMSKGKEDWPMKIRLTENAMCAHDLHELTNYPRPWFKAKPTLQKDTVLTVKEQWTNFFGSYYRCDHENGTYDIKCSEAEIIEM